MSSPNPHNTALARITPPGLPDEIDVFKLGDVLAKSHYFADAKEASQCIVKVLAGRELGFGPIASMSGVHLINGKPSLAANLMAAAVKRQTGPYNYRVRQLDDDACELEFFERGEAIGKSRFTMEDAKRAGVLDGPNKHTWKKYPRNMLFSRAMSNGARWYTPDIFGGPVYTPEEMNAPIDSEGQIVGGIETAEQVSAQTAINSNARVALPATAPTGQDDEQQRKSRAQGIFALGLVTQDGERFQVRNNGISKEVFEVWQDKSARQIRCTCAEYNDRVKVERNFRCVHILAAQIFTVQKNEGARAVETAAIGFNDSPEVTAEQLRAIRVQDIKDLCVKLNEAGADPKWNPAQLRKHINETFQVSDGLDSLGADSFDELERDLKNKLDGLLADEQPFGTATATAPAEEEEVF